MSAKVGVPGAVGVGERVHWIGALDPGMRTFDLILRTPNGTTYNSYCVRGSDGVAIIDTVKEEHADAFFARLEAVCRYDEIKAIVLNHLEPDHAGALPELVRRAPQARLYISASGLGMLKAILKRLPNAERIPCTTVTTGDTVSLGDRSLHFLQTPYLHWPDTMCTWVPEERILFSGDVFGCHFCDARLFDDRCGDFRFAFDYYYAHIMRPFRQFVLDALELIDPLDARCIAPAHGPILRSQHRRFVERYRQLSQPREASAEKSLLVFYLSSYGNTKRMAEAVADGASQIDGLRVSLYDLEGAEIEPFVDLIEDIDAIAIGSPTINGDAVKTVWDLLSSLTRVHVKGKIGAAFGSYGWSGEAVRLIEERMRGLKLRTPVNGVKVKLIPNEQDLDTCRAFGDELGRWVLGKQAPREIDLSDLVAAPAA